MLLDIIIPHGNEPWSVMQPCINMLNAQKGVDFDDFMVTIVHDGSEPFPEFYLNGPANIRQVSIPKRGVSAARNYGLSISNAVWVNFSDCDDCFSSVISLNMLFRGLRQNDGQFDMMWSPFYMIQDDQVSKFDQFNRVFIHNKYYRRSTLMEKNIWFNEDIFMSEDSAFNTLLIMNLEEGKIGQIVVTDPLYAWCRRKGSITMSPDRWMEITVGHYERNRYILSEYQAHGDTLNSKIMVYRCMTDLYAMITKPGVNGDPAEAISKAKEFWLANQDILQNYWQDTHFQIALQYSCTEMGNPKYKVDDFEEWIAKFATL